MNKINNPLENIVIGSNDLKHELYTVPELAEMFKTSTQHIGKLLKSYDIKTITISLKESKRQTHRISKDEVLRLRQFLGM